MEIREVVKRERERGRRERKRGGDLEYMEGLVYDGRRDIFVVICRKFVELMVVS